MSEGWPIHPDSYGAPNAPSKQGNVGVYSILPRFAETSKSRHIYSTLARAYRFLPSQLIVTGNEARGKVREPTLVR